MSDLQNGAALQRYLITGGVNAGLVGRELARESNREGVVLLLQLEDERRWPQQRVKVLLRYCQAGDFFIGDRVAKAGEWRGVIRRKLPDGRLMVEILETAVDTFRAAYPTDLQLDQGATR